MGENFGNAILESLNYGRPVILSDKTPWNEVAEFGSGWVIKKEAKFFNILKVCMNMADEEYLIMSKSYIKYAKHFFTPSNPLGAYLRLFR
ncbi:MAG: hypothetical protein EPO57_04095 [Chitinophagaceae bacterium]|nr:MAG: hypothetical protein EPO57_04095 [Chitinophagaceae bacterium]